MPSVILVIDDDHDYRRTIVRHLRLIKYGVLEAANSEEALVCLERHDIDLILLEVALGASTVIKTIDAEPLDLGPTPGSSWGYDLLEIIRAASRYVPVIALTVMNRHVDELTCIRGGADTFLRKPIELNLLTAYLTSNLRRVALLRDARQEDWAKGDQRANGAEKQPSVLHAGDLLIDTKHRLVRVQNSPYCSFSEKEIRVLSLLAQSPGKVFSKQDLMRKVWGDDPGLGEQAVEAAVKRIRKKIESQPGKPRYILNARGMGYRFSTGQPRNEIASSQPESAGT